MTLTFAERETLIEWIIASNGGEREAFQRLSDKEIESEFIRLRDKSLEEAEDN